METLCGAVGEVSSVGRLCGGRHCAPIEGSVVTGQWRRCCVCALNRKWDFLSFGFFEPRRTARPSVFRFFPVFNRFFGFKAGSPPKQLWGLTEPGGGPIPGWTGRSDPVLTTMLKWHAHEERKLNAQCTLICFDKWGKLNHCICFEKDKRALEPAMFTSTLNKTPPLLLLTLSQGACAVRGALIARCTLLFFFLLHGAHYSSLKCYVVSISKKKCYVVRSFKIDFLLRIKKGIENYIFQPTH